MYPRGSPAFVWAIKARNPICRPISAPNSQWLASQSQPSVASLASYIQRPFGVVFRSSQSYYDLLSQAGYRWKKTQARSPKADPQAGIARRAEIKKTSRA